MMLQFFVLSEIAGLNSFQLLQTVTGDGKGQDEQVVSTEEHGAIVRKLTASQSKKHLALLANEWSSSSSESSCSMEDVKQHMMNGTHADLKGNICCCCYKRNIISILG